MSYPIDGADRITTTIGAFDRHHFVVITIEAGGLVGNSYAWVFTETQADAVARLVLDTGRAVVGANAADISKNWDLMMATLRLTGRTGLGLYAVAAIDTCLWDLVGRALKKPIWRLFGTSDIRPVELYASGLFLSSSIAQLSNEADRYLKDGYRALKMRLGKPTLAEDAERVGIVRESVGPQVKLMLDAALAWDERTAIERVNSLVDLQPFWIEDPVDYWEGVDLAALARVKDASPIPITAGEFISGLPAFRKAIDLRAADTLMLDVQHLGGLTPCLMACAAGKVSEQPLVGHIFPELTVHLTAINRWSEPMEYVPWSEVMFDSGPRPVNGFLELPHEPGLGYTFDLKSLEAHTEHGARIDAG